MIIPTAEEFWANLMKQKSFSMTEAIKEFAKLHVEAALEAASKNAEMKSIKYFPNEYEIDKKSIINSYPLTNIK